MLEKHVLTLLQINALAASYVISLVIFVFIVQVGLQINADTFYLKRFLFIYTYFTIFLG